MIGDTGRRDGPSMSYRRGVVRENFRSVRPPYQQQWKPQVHSNYRRDQPPKTPPRHNRPNFIIQLRSEDNQSFERIEVEDLIAKLKCMPDRFSVFDGGICAACLFFQQWTDALETIVFLWETRFDGTHFLTPQLICNLIVPSDTDELNGRLKVLFLERVKGFIEGDLVIKLQKKLALVLNEINKINASLGKPNRLPVHSELLQRKKGLMSQRDLIANRINEFKSGMKCILGYLEGKISSEGYGEDGVNVLNLNGGFDWCRIHCLMMRECRRLEDGLPIYAFRKEILKQIHCQQVITLEIFFFCL